MLRMYRKEKYVYMHVAITLIFAHEVIYYFSNLDLLLKIMIAILIWKTSCLLSLH